MKKIISIILIVATIINIIAGALIFGDIRAMELPETQLILEVVDLNAEEAIIQTTLWTKNPNTFSIFIQNFTIETTSDSTIINHISFVGGEIPAHENRTYTSTAPIRFNGTIPQELTSTITGTIGVMFLGIVKKTLPLHFSMRTPLTIIVDQLTLPSISLQGNFSDITQTGVNFTETVTITNPYSFDLTIGNLSTDVINNNGVSVGMILTQGAFIPAHTTRQLQGTGVIRLEALDATILTMNLTGTVMVMIAGIRKSINLSVNTEMIPPSLDRLLSNLPTETSLSGTYKATLKGLRDRISFEIFNPHNITLLATNVTVFIYRVDDGKQRLLCKGSLPDGIIVPQNKTVIQGDMIIPYHQIRHQRGERVLMDRLAVTIRANITIQGLNQTIWIAITGYQDFGTRHIFNIFP